MRDLSWQLAYRRSAEKYPRGGTRFIVATSAWLLMCVMVIAVGIALSIGLVHDDTANSSPLTQGLALIGAALFSALVYYLLVIRRLAREQREGR